MNFNATQFLQQMQFSHQAVVAINDDDFVIVTSRANGYDCRFIRFVGHESELNGVLAEYRATCFADIVSKAEEALRERVPAASY